MAVPGPDSGYSWVIVLCCSYIHFALFGLFRSSGVIYVAMLQNYDATREEASWPFALCAAVFQLVGPVVSVITRYISQRKACLLGSAVATIGVAGCYFAGSVMWINIFYGIVHGSGFGVVVTLVAVVLSQYFVKHRATAIGIAFSGGTLSSLIFPSVMEWLLENYTLRDSFLLLSCVVMNMLVASSLLRAPPWLTTTPLDDKDSGVLCSSSTTETETKSNNRGDSCETDIPLNQINGREDMLVSSNHDCAMFENDEKASPGGKEPLMRMVRVEIVPKKALIAPPPGLRHSIRDIIKTPSFHLITYTTCVFFLGVHAFFMVIVDFAKDKGIPESKGIYIISMFSLTDFIGRVGLGWVTDRNYISRRSMVALNLGTLGVLYQLYPVIDSLSGILVIAACAGVAVGSSVCLFIVLQAECFHMNQLTMVIGMTSFVNGVMALLRPGIIGLFRDVIGSYDWMFHLLGFNYLLVSIIWFIASWKKRASDSQRQLFKT